MEIEAEVEKILKEEGIAPPAMSQKEFMQRLGEKIATLVPQKLVEVVKTASGEIIGEEMKRLGRDAACKFYQGPRKCAKGLDTSQCLECLSYQPKRERWKWLHNLYRGYPERWEWGLIGVGTLAWAAAIISPELRLWVVIFWFIMFIVSRLQVIFMWKLVRTLNRGTLRWLK